MIKKYLVLHQPEKEVAPKKLHSCFPEEDLARGFLRQSGSMGTIRWCSSTVKKALDFWGMDKSTSYPYQWLVSKILSGQLRFPNYQGSLFKVGRDEYDSDKYLS